METLSLFKVIISGEEKKQFESLIFIFQLCCSKYCAFAMATELRIIRGFYLLLCKKESKTCRFRSISLVKKNMFFNRISAIKTQTWVRFTWWYSERMLCISSTSSEEISLITNVWSYDVSISPTLFLSSSLSGALRAKETCEDDGVTSLGNKRVDKILLLLTH